MNNIVEDISTLTTLPEKTINNFFKKLVYCSCQALAENILKGENISELDIGIGTLYVKHCNNQPVKYHFKPSEFFAKSIEDTVENGTNLLIENSAQTLAKKFKEAYKDLC